MERGEEKILDAPKMCPFLTSFQTCFFLPPWDVNAHRSCNFNSEISWRSDYKWPASAFAILAQLSPLSPCNQLRQGRQVSVPQVLFHSSHLHFGEANKQVDHNSAFHFAAKCK